MATQSLLEPEAWRVSQFPCIQLSNRTRILKWSMPAGSMFVLQLCKRNNA